MYKLLYPGLIYFLVKKKIRTLNVIKEILDDSHESERRDKEGKEECVLPVIT